MPLLAPNRRLFLLAASAVTMSACATATAQTTETGLDGYWEGALENVVGAGVAPPPTSFPPVRLFIYRDTVRVFMNDGGSVEEVKPGTFSIRREGPNAVITSIQSDPGNRIGTSWVETWTFVVTLGDADTLIVNYVRIVNNTSLPAGRDEARFSQMRTGQLRRIYPADV